MGLDSVCPVLYIWVWQNKAITGIAILRDYVVHHISIKRVKILPLLIAVFNSGSFTSYQISLSSPLTK